MFPVIFMDALITSLALVIRNKLTAFNNSGVDVLNEAIDWMYYHMPPEKWTFVNVAVAPSTITITEHGVSELFLIFWREGEVCRIK